MRLRLKNAILFGIIIGVLFQLSAYDHAVSLVNWQLASTTLLITRLLGLFGVLLAATGRRSFKGLTGGVLAGIGAGSELMNMALTGTV